MRKLLYVVVVIAIIAVLVGTFLFTISSFSADLAIGNFSLTGLTGFTLFDTKEPLGIASSILSISGVAVAAVAGFVGGLIRR